MLRCTNKYKNKYIPITDGKVEKAPAVIYKDGVDAEGRIHIISDNIFGINNHMSNYYALSF